jgi:metallo-beta-lactamase class B
MRRRLSLFWIIGIVGAIGVGGYPSIAGADPVPAASPRAAPAPSTSTPPPAAAPVPASAPSTPAPAGAPAIASPASPPESSSIFAPDPDPTLDPDPPLAPGQVISDKEIIRRVIRRHINEVKQCYEAELGKKDTLSGRIMVKFTVAASGEVVASSLQDSTMDNPRVESCTVQALRGWRFPKPRGGGAVVISYPFDLTPTASIVVVAGKNGAGGVDILPLSPRIFVHRSSDAHGVPSNGLIAVVDGGLLLVDTAWTAAQTEAILRWAEDRLGARFIGAVITHDHGDRAGGISALFQRKIPVAALDLTVDKLARRDVHGVAPLFTARAGATKDPRGFEAFYPGPGHAADNIVLAFPAAGVLFGGCLIKSIAARDLGFTGDADRAAWPAAIRRVAERFPHPGIIVPGHGAVDMIGTSSYQHTLDLLNPRPAKVEPREIGLDRGR